MAQQILNNGETGGIIRGKINDNFTELYSNKVVSFRGRFVNSDIIGGIFTITHGLNLPTNDMQVAVFIYDNANSLRTQLIGVVIHENTVDFNFSSFGAISGTWSYLIMR